MLELITKSKLRKKIILLLVYNKEESFYINQLAKITETSAGNIQRELKRLEKNDLLLKEKRGNMVFYRINTHNPLFSEFKSIVDKTIGIEKIIKEELEKIKGVDFAFLFGSYVKKDFHAESDIDLYVIGSVKEDDVHGALQKAENAINREINYHMSEKEEFEKNLQKSFFHEEITKKYILLIGNEDEFRKITR